MSNTTPRWYVLAQNGMATLCLNRADALRTLADADASWPRLAPHRAVLLGDVETIERDRASWEGETGVLRSLLADALAWIEEACADQPDPESLPHLQALRDRMRAALVREKGALL